MSTEKNKGDHPAGTTPAYTDDTPPTVSQPLRHLLGRLKREAARNPEEEVARGRANEEQRRQRAVSEAMGSLANQLGQRYSPERAKLATFRLHEDAAVAARQTVVLSALRSINLCETIRAGGGLVLVGTVGSGKDHLLAAMLYGACRAGFSCFWLGGQEFYGELRDRMDSGESEGKRFAELKRPDVLAISDPLPPYGSPSDWNVSQVYRLVDRRYRDLRCTWITINAKDDAEADEKLSAPVWDRLRENALILRCFWPSFRETKGGPQ